VGERVHAADDLAKPRHPFANPRHWRTMDLAIADEAVIGADFCQDDIPGFDRLSAVQAGCGRGTEIM